MPAFTDPWLPTPDGGSPVPSARPAIDVRVYRVGATGTLTELPNVRCIAVEEHEGPAPATALFRYVFDGRDPSGPQSVEQALSTSYTTASLPHLVEVGDNLGVRATTPDGDKQWIFHGPVLTFSAKLDGTTEHVHMAATGIAKRLWDNPVVGALQRATDNPETVNDIQTDVIAQFNPRGAPNASPSTADAGVTGGVGTQGYPTFLDPNIKTATDANSVDYPRPWTLPMACAYLIYTGNNAQTYVKNPDRAALEALLVSRQPIDGTPFDPNNPDTYTATPIQAPDTPLTGHAWPALVHDMVKDCGFGTRFGLSTDTDGSPKTTFVIFLKQAAVPKPFLLQERGARFDPSLSNTHDVQLGRDLAGVVNSWRVAGGLKRYEASFILAPCFESAAADSTNSGALAQFDNKAAATDTSDFHDKYRLWVFDEAGEKHYANASTSAITGTATSLDNVLGAPAGSPPVATYVKRRRPPIGTLFTPDATGKPLKYRLSISKVYSGAYPAVWDASGANWQPVNGGYELLKDRIGIWISTENPNKWNVGKSETVSDPFPDGIVKAVECIGNPSSENPPFFLRLTCVIEGDQALSYTALREINSPLAASITREIDARDRILYHELAKHSEFNTGGTSQVVRDDTVYAKAEAFANRTATEAGVMEGEVTIPRFTAYYGIGDRINGLLGRDLGFRTDTGGPGAAPVLPMVVSRRWELDGGQRTVLAVSDAGLDRRRYARKWPAATGSKHGVAPNTTVSAGGGPRGINMDPNRPRSARDNA